MAKIFKPIGDRAIIRKDALVEKTASGLFLPESASVESFVEATVIEASDGFHGDGGWVDLQIKAGDRVIVGKESGIAVVVDGQKYHIIRQPEIFGIVV